MDLFNLIPQLNGYKTLIGSYALLILGIGAFLVGLGNLFLAVGHCMQSFDLQVCKEGITPAWQALVVAFSGLTALGLGHKLNKANS